MKIDAEMITYLAGHFENNEVCDALIKEREADCTKEEEISIQIFNKKEDFFLNNSSSEYRNKPNRVKTLIEKEMMLGLKRGKKTGHQIEAINQKTEAEAKLEIVITDEIKVKALKGLYFHQEITKTEGQEVKPRIIVKNMIKIKETFFQKVGLQKNLKPS